MPPPCPALFAGSDRDPAVAPSTRIAVGHGARRLAPRAACWAWLACVLAICLGQTGCVFRRMTVRSDPPGALVVLDGEEVGYTPYTCDFTYYGTREITLIKDGYETLTVMQKVPTPWYQYPVIEFFADNLSPHKITNRNEFFYRMQRQVAVPTQELLDRANNLRSETQVGP